MRDRRKKPERIARAIRNAHHLGPTYVDINRASKTLTVVAIAPHSTGVGKVFVANTPPLESDGVKDVEIEGEIYRIGQLTLPENMRPYIKFMMKRAGW